MKTTNLLYYIILFISHVFFLCFMLRRKSRNKIVHQQHWHVYLCSVCLTDISSIDARNFCLHAESHMLKFFNALCWESMLKYVTEIFKMEKICNRNITGVKIYPYNTTAIFKVFKVWCEMWSLMEKFKSKIKMTEFDCLQVTRKIIMSNETLYKKWILFRQW
jgi:hypothetical protein